jgi:hypothetical protein
VCMKVMGSQGSVTNSNCSNRSVFQFALDTLAAVTTSVSYLEFDAVEVTLQRLFHGEL